MLGSQGLFLISFIELEQPVFSMHGVTLEPVKGLGCRIGLIIVVPVGECCQFVQIFSQLGCFVRKMNEPIFNRARDRVHPHDFIHCRFVFFDLMHPLTDKFLDQLSARRLVFDHDGLRIKRPSLFP